MDPVFLILRILHILLGVFWAGTIFFFTFFLLPSLAEMGPDAGKLMAGLQKRRYTEVMPIVAIITIIAGLLMYYRVSGGFDPAYMRSHYGMGYGVGGASAIIAFAIGIVMIRPAAARLGEVMVSLPSTPAGAERDAKMAEAAKLRAKAALGSRLVAVFLLVTVIMMAITRYL